MSSKIVIEEVEDDMPTTKDINSSTAGNGETTAAAASERDLDETAEKATATDSGIAQKRTAINSGAYYFNVQQAIKEDFAAAEAAKAQQAIDDSTTITLDTIMKECVRQGYYRTPSCNEKLYLHHKGFNKIAEGAFDQYTDVKVMWLEGNCFVNERRNKATKHDQSNETKTEESDEKQRKESTDLNAFHSPGIFRSQHDTLRQMYLHGNLFTTTPRALAGFHVLDNINLSDNFIEAIEYFAPPAAIGTDQQQQDNECSDDGSVKLNSPSDTDKKRQKEGFSVKVQNEKQYAWIDKTQDAWDAMIKQILEGMDDDDTSGNISDEKETPAPSSPSKGVSKSEKASRIQIENEDTAKDVEDESKNSHLLLSDDNEEEVNRKNEVAKRLKRFQKAIAAAVAMRSVPIPDNGILSPDAPGNNKWATTLVKKRQDATNNNDNIDDESKVNDETNTQVPSNTTKQHLSDTVTWIQLKNNHLKEPKDLLQLLTFSNLTSLDLSNNRIENRDGEFLMLLSAMPQLKSLMLQGNPCVRQITPQYRKQILKVLPNLMYLDDRPVFADERRMITAWASGGADGEKKERAAMKAEEEEAVRKRLAEFRALMQRRGELEEGQASESDSNSTSTDDDDEEEVVSNNNRNANEGQRNTSGRPTTAQPRVLSSNGTSRPTTAFYDRNYGPNSADPAPIHRQQGSRAGHVDPTADAQVVTAADDAPNTVSWGNYIIRDRNTTTSSSHQQQHNDDDFSDVVIGH